MWLVLEGIDGAGKTTLANRLCALDTRYTVQHVGPPAKAGDFIFVPTGEVHVGGSFLELAKYWSVLSNQTADHIIWDRGHLGNWVYQHGENRMGVAEMRLLEAILMSHNGLTAVLNTDPEKAFNRHSGDRKLGDLYVESIQFQQQAHELKSYWVAMDAMGITTAFHDWQKYDETKHMDDEGVGSNKPYIWILGEQRNPNAQIQVPFSTTSGLKLVWPWVNPLTMRLSNALRPSADLERGRQGLFDVDELSNLYFRWTTLDRPRVIALGHTAREACRMAGVKTSLELEHPQHIWRFQQSEAEEWSRRAERKVGMIA
jgi:hypothetical protein